MDTYCTPEGHVEHGVQVVSAKGWHRPVRYVPAPQSRHGVHVVSVEGVQLALA